VDWRKLINYLAGDIAGDAVREGPRIQSVCDGFHQWQVKQTKASEDQFISLYFKPSFGYGHSGDPFTYLYVEIDLPAARRSVDSLSEIINIMENKG
jgi:hypothetical protein